MSTHTRIKTIETELSKINHEIDNKILKGLSYKKEARHHKFLRSHLSDILRGKASRRSHNWLHKASYVMRTFLL